MTTSDMGGEGKRNRDAFYNDLTLDKHFIEYDNDENPTEREYKEA